MYAQHSFVQLLLLGFFMVTSGAIVITLSPSEASCKTVSWCITLGYSLELIPVLVKTSAINKIMHSAMKFQRVNLSPRDMLQNILVPLIIVCAFLTSWTIVDPSVPVENRVMAGGNTVESFLGCSSESNSWYFVSLGWQVTLLFMAVVLAVQSRNVVKEYNESKDLGVMVYSHFFFMMLRILFYSLQNSDLFRGDVISAMFALNYTLDSGFGLAIYYAPKLSQARADPSAYTAQTANVTNVVEQIAQQAALEQARYQESQRRASLERFSILYPAGEGGNNGNQLSPSMVDELKECISSSSSEGPLNVEGEEEQEINTDPLTQEMSSDNLTNSSSAQSPPVVLTMEDIDSDEEESSKNGHGEEEQHSSDEYNEINGEDQGPPQT